MRSVAHCEGVKARPGSHHSPNEHYTFVRFLSTTKIRDTIVSRALLCYDGNTDIRLQTKDTTLEKRATQLVYRSVELSSTVMIPF